LGWRVIAKINQIIREEMNSIGGQEMLMPLLHPKTIWNETGRWDKADEIMYKLKDTRNKEFVLSFTHEEIVVDLLRKHVVSYQDLPVSIYHFSTTIQQRMNMRNGKGMLQKIKYTNKYSSFAKQMSFMLRNF